MAYREIGMWEILEVLRRVARGEPQRAIHRATGHSRSSIRRWVLTAHQLGFAPGGDEPDEALARAVAQQLKLVGRPPARDGSAARLQPHRERIEAWLHPEGGGRGLRLTKVRVLLAREGIQVPYSSLHRFATHHCRFQERRRLTVRVAQGAPGECAEVDFGQLGRVWDRETQRQRMLYALLVTLPYSRHQYVHVTYTQKLPDLIQGLEDAWAFFDGVPARVVLDNLKAAVTKAHRYQPLFQRTFAEYARYRGFVIDATLPRHPQGKPTVERNVPYLRESFFRGESWLDRDHVQRQARQWCLTVAGQRVHGTTRQRPLAVFENEERDRLQPLVAPRFDPPHWAQAKVQSDHHIQFQKALYSVPTRYVGQLVTVRGDAQLVRIFVEGACVKTHPRVPAGRRSTDYHDYPRELAPYARRDPQALVGEGHRQGPHIGAFLEKLLAGDFPWAKLRQGQALLRLSNQYGHQRVDAACHRALSFELLNTQRVRRILERGLDRQADPETPGGQLVALPARFLRPQDSFTHSPNHQEKPHANQPFAAARDEAPETLGTARHAPRSGRVRTEDKTP